MKLSATFGMWEMENAAEMVMKAIAKTKKQSQKQTKEVLGYEPINFFDCFSNGPVGVWQVNLRPEQFITEDRKTLEGFVLLVANGWLIAGYPNGCFWASKNFVARVKQKFPNLNEDELLALFLDDDGI